MALGKNVQEIGVIEKFSFATLEWIVFQTGIELEPGGRPAYAGTENVQRPPGCRAEPDTHTGHLGELFNNAKEIETFLNRRSQQRSMLKADFHTHVKEDPRDEIGYTAKQLIAHAAKLHYDVLAITCHDYVLFSSELAAFARQRGILLIPGAERTIEGRHVLLYNVTNDDLRFLRTFNDLRMLRRRKQVITIAPHPFFLFGQCLGPLLEKHINLFDAIEYSHYHTHLVNRNRRAEKLARRYHKPLVGTSDCHHLWQFSRTHSLINSAKTKDAVLAAIKAGSVRHVSPPLPLGAFAAIAAWIGLTLLRRKLGLMPVRSHAVLP